MSRPDQPDAGQIFITVGSCQGKVAFAKEQFPERILMSAYPFSVEKYVREGNDTVEQTEAMLQMNPEVVIIMSEMGCKVDPERRAHQIGRVEQGFRCVKGSLCTKERFYGGTR